MSQRNRLILQVFVVAFAILLPPALAHAQRRGEQGKPIGKVSVSGNVIVMELDENALGQQHLFDLEQHTLRFTPGTGGYRVENLPLRWDPDFGPALNGSRFTLRNFAFPFSGKTWQTLSVGVTGSVRFVDASADSAESGQRSLGYEYGGDQGGVSIGRFDPLSEAATNLVNSVPAICVFFKPRMSGDRYVKELTDRAIVTWDVTEPYGNIQDFTWTKTVNRFQAVLHKDGAIEMSYQRLTAKDAVVGVYPTLAAGNEKPLATIAGAKNSGAAANLDIQNVKLAVVDDLFVKVTIETAGPVLPEGDAGIAGIGYRVNFAGKDDSAGATWAIFGFAPPSRGPNQRPPRYVAFGPGVSRRVTVSGNTISMQGILPSELRGAAELSVSAEAFTSASDSEKLVAEVAAQQVSLKSMRNPEVHFSSLKPQGGPFPTVFESFHYYALPNMRDLACTVIKGLGDKYDFLAYYSDFRVDNQEAGTPSDGPLGSTGDAVTGIHAPQEGLASYCSAGRFQWAFVQPVYVDAIQMQERPPADAPMGSDHDITFYQKQLAEISQDGQMPPYMYAISQIGHEMGHRWSAFVNAKVGDETIPLGPTHWARGLQAVDPFPYRRPSEASIMGGGVWQDNFDGTFTQLDDDYYVPATGYSYLDLYLMGLIAPAEVPDFFILRNLTRTGRDANGHPIFKADRTKVTIQDVIAAEGPRTPGVDKSQRQFNTGMVVVVQHGQTPSQKLVDETNGIRTEWMKYFSIVTGQRASMTANPQ